MRLDEMVEDVEREGPDLGDPTGAVRAVRGVTDVDDRLVGQLVENGARDSQAAHAAVEDADRRVHPRNLSVAPAASHQAACRTRPEGVSTVTTVMPRSKC